MAQAKPRKPTGLEIWAKRKKLGLTQAEFWNAVGMTQSAGARYENGRTIPEPVLMCIRARYYGRPVPVYRSK